MYNHLYIVRAWGCAYGYFNLLKVDIFYWLTSYMYNVHTVNVFLRGPLFCCQPNVFILHPHKKIHEIPLITSGDAEKENKRLRRH